MKKKAKEKFIGSRMFSISETACSLKVTRQAVYLAIKMKRLHADKQGKFWKISSHDIKDYIENRYNRLLSTHEGALIFDKNKGTYCINEVATILNTNVNRIYYMVRMGMINSSRIGGNIIIKKDDIEEYVVGTWKNSGKKIALC